MSFLRHARSIGPMWVNSLRTYWERPVPPPFGRPRELVQGRESIAPCSSSAMSRTGYSLAGWSPPEPASASPDASILV